MTGRGWPCSTDSTHRATRTAARDARAELRASGARRPPSSPRSSVRSASLEQRANGAADLPTRAARQSAGTLGARAAASRRAPLTGWPPLAAHRRERLAGAEVTLVDGLVLEAVALGAPREHPGADARRAEVEPDPGATVLAAAAAPA